jgi:hypothetical protein
MFNCRTGRREGLNNFLILLLIYIFVRLKPAKKVRLLLCMPIGSRPVYLMCNYRWKSIVKQYQNGVKHPHIGRHFIAKSDIFKSIKVFVRHKLAQHASSIAHTQP